jgi:hypothetical protein
MLCPVTNPTLGFTHRAKFDRNEVPFNDDFDTVFVNQLPTLNQCSHLRETGFMVVGRVSFYSLCITVDKDTERKQIKCTAGFYSCELN